jgi:hypothetical protein
MTDLQLDKYRKVVDQYGQAEAARRSGLAASTINQVYHNKYTADPASVISVVLELVGGEKKKAIPEGFMEDGQGRLVRVENVRPIDKARDELVREFVGKAVAVSRMLETFKRSIMDDISAFVDLSAERYQVDLGGNKGNVTLTSYDRRYKVQLAVAESLVFDEGLLAAKALIDECINDWSAESGPEIRTLINDAFEPDQNSRINTRRVLRLRRLDIKDERWRRAMDAISDSVAVAGSKSYVRIYERDDSGKYRQLAMDMATV